MDIEKQKNRYLPDIITQTENRISDNEFNLLKSIIYRESGISLSLKKKTLIISRLNKRLRILNLKSFMDYYNYLQSADGQNFELVKMIDEISTNKTSFFREKKQFDFLLDYGLKTLLSYLKSKNKTILKIWSTSCSTGEEPYTIAMILEEFFSKYKNLKIPYEILATDISTNVLKKAKKAIYNNDKINNIESSLIKKYFMYGTDAKDGLYRIVPEIRKKIKFARFNITQKHLFKEKFDIIFCRNVMIYFDETTKNELLNNLYDNIIVGGFLFIGESETLHSLKAKNKFKYILPTIYQKGI